MMSSGLTKRTPLQVCEGFYCNAVQHLRRKAMVMRIPLEFRAKGKTCRLFVRHGPIGKVIEPAFSPDGEVLTVAEFETMDVLECAAVKLGLK